jgi:hypothetical protein
MVRSLKVAPRFLGSLWRPGDFCGLFGVAVSTYTACVKATVCKGKVKCTLVQALRLCTGRTAHRGSRGIALLFHDHGTRRGWGVSVTPRPLFTLGKDPVPIVQEAGWAPGLVWTGAKNLAPTGIRSPDRSQSLHRIRYPAHRRYVSECKYGEMAGGCRE